MRRIWATAMVLALLGAGSASAAWEQPVGGPSPINASPEHEARGSSLEVVAGVPYLAWEEADGVNTEIRVARLNAGGTAWERVGETTEALQGSPINRSPTQPARFASLAEVNGVPYVAWSEPDSLSDKIRVARLNSAGTAWERVGEQITPGYPINQRANRSAWRPSLTAIGGVPHVAWEEEDEGTEVQIRVARLRADERGWVKVGQTLNSDAPINQGATNQATSPDLIGIGGVPYVTWSEYEGPSVQVRVARLNPDGTGWDKVGQTLNPASPINEITGAPGVAEEPSLAAVAGVPYVAWAEDDGPPAGQIRVARLNADETGWEKVGQALEPASPINASPNENAHDPSLTVINGIPYVAWQEPGPNDQEIRVARLNADGTGWDELVGGPSPIRESTIGSAVDPSLVSVAGVPYVAWGEAGKVRVGRLEPEFISQAATPGTTSADLSATWRTYGVEFPIGFEFGGALESSTSPATAPPYEDAPTITQRITGLAPATAYQFRSVVVPGAEPRLFSETASFTTAPDTTPPQTTITKDPPNKLEKSKATYKFTSSEPNSTFRCKFDKRKFKPCDAGKLKLKRLDDGKHKFKVIATDAAGNSDPSPAKDKFKVL